ncbi:MAG: gephyrin-like molybdotransferase Glp [Pseudomonadota bacterium]
MLSVSEALDRILAEVKTLPAEQVALPAAAGRVVAGDVVARIDHPPFRASAMDGYAVRFEDAKAGARLRLLGEAAAGAPFARKIGAGEAVRIFTGGAVPDGADHIVIQEEARAEGAEIVVTAPQPARANIREAGIDFRAWSTLKARGARLSPIDLGLIAAANFAAVDATRKPIVAYFDNGDELVEPGAGLRAGQIVGSNRFAMDGLIAHWGGAPYYLGRAGDNLAAVAQKFEEARKADIIVAVGGASVGEHDHARRAFEYAGGTIIFSKVAVKPGKPTWFGRLNSALVLGLPGNPASAIVCSILFLRPLMATLEGEGNGAHGFVRARLATPIKANGAREAYLRGALTVDPSAVLTVTPFAKEDSSLFSPLAMGNCLIRCAASAPAALAGDLADCIVYKSFPDSGP